VSSTLRLTAVRPTLTLSQQLAHSRSLRFVTNIYSLMQNVLWFTRRICVQIAGIFHCVSVCGRIRLVIRNLILNNAFDPKFVRICRLNLDGKS